MIARLLSPFSGTYRKLDLRMKWWHRLSFVLLIFCLAATTYFTFALTFVPDGDGDNVIGTITPVLTSESAQKGPWDDYKPITNLPPLPKGYTAQVMLSGLGERLQFPADTTRGELIKALCEHLKDGDAACWEVISQGSIGAAGGPAESTKLPVKPSLWRLFLKDVGIALATALVLSYLLQLAYRAVIFVVYGNSERSHA
jgi:hypothetical protein